MDEKLEETTPNLKVRAKELIETADPGVDRALLAVAASRYSVVFVFVAALAIFGLGVWTGTKL